MPSGWWIFSCSLLAAAVASPTSARAEGPYEGEWRASARSVRIELDSWGDDCPANVPLRQSEPGGAVGIRQSGDHLIFTGAVQARTDRCWSDQPGLQRSSASFQGSTWTVSCRTPTSIAQGESGRYVLRAEGQDRIVLEETTEWDWRLRTSRCTARRRSRQTFTREVPETALFAPQSPATPSPCRPGAPARVHISPRAAELYPGDRVCFRTRVTDAAGCEIPDRAVRLSLRRAAGRGGALEGRCFLAGETAADAEGQFQVDANGGNGLKSTARISVVVDDLTDIVAQDRPTALPTVEGDAELAGSSSVTARTASTGSPSWLLGLGALVLLVLLVLGVAVLLVTRGRSRTALPTAGATPTTISGSASRDGGPNRPHSAAPASAASVPLPVSPSARGAGATSTRHARTCPVCSFEDDAGAQDYCPNDGAPLLDPNAPEVRAQGMICPSCRRGYPAGTRQCGADQEELVPYAFYLAREKHEGSAGKKVCPTCGASYDADRTFCGEDGSPLETLN